MLVIYTLQGKQVYFLEPKGHYTNLHEIQLSKAFGIISY